MTAVSVRIINPDEATLRRAVQQADRVLQARFGSLPSQPGPPRRLARLRQFRGGDSGGRADPTPTSSRGAALMKYHPSPLEVSAHLRLWECRPAVPVAGSVESYVRRAPSGLRERYALCPKCGQDVGYSTLFGYAGHVRPCAPRPPWADDPEAETTPDVTAERRP
jgi:hypothetical protein